MLPINVCRVKTSEGDKDYVTCLPLDGVCERGLAPESIIGVILQPLKEGERITPSVFARNRIFVDFMHEVIARRGPAIPGLVTEAQRQGEGLVCIIDLRTRNPQGPIPTQDIVGIFAAKGGQLVPDSYKPNPNHQTLSADGFFQLPDELQECLLEEMAGRC